jgi:hypothetical protein
MSRKRKQPVISSSVDLTSREAVDRFRKVAAEFTEKAVRSRESAIKALVESGIYTKSGKLTKNYRP